LTPDLIFITLSTFAEGDREPLRLLEASGRPHRINTTGKRITTAQLLDQGRAATVVIAGVEPYDAATLECLPFLRCISRCGVGVDSIDLAAARARSIVVLNTPLPPAAAVAELALAMMLSLCRNLPRQAARARNNEWARIEAHLLGGRHVGIVGFGRIGRRVAELLKPFGCRISAADPAVEAASAGALGVNLVPLDKLIADCDVISIHAARSSDEPVHFGREELAAMKRGTIVINVARGGMIDEVALYDALVSGHLAGAGLDVFEQEPYAGPLCDLDKVVLTPHAGTLTVETRAAMERECVAKALQFLDGTLAPDARVI